MATPAQKQVKEPIRALHKEGLFTETVYSPSKRKRVKSIKWPTIIVLAIFLLGAIPSLYDQYIESKHERMVNYLNATFNINTSSSELITQFNNSSETPTIQAAKATLLSLLTEAKENKAPHAFKEYNQLFLEVLEQKLFILTYIEITGKLKQFDENDLNSHLVKLNHVQTSMINELKSTFNQEHIKYTEQPDGSLMFWYKSYSGVEYPHNYQNHSF